MSFFPDLVRLWSVFTNVKVIEWYRLIGLHIRFTFIQYKKKKYRIPVKKLKIILSSQKIVRLEKIFIYHYIMCKKTVWFCPLLFFHSIYRLWEKTLDSKSMNTLYKKTWKLQSQTWTFWIFSNIISIISLESYAEDSSHYQIIISRHLENPRRFFRDCQKSSSEFSNLEISQNQWLSRSKSFELRNSNF